MPPGRAGRRCGQQGKRGGRAFVPSAPSRGLSAPSRGLSAPSRGGRLHPAGNLRRAATFSRHRLSPKACDRKDHPVKNVTTALIALLGLGALAACNTVSGAGKDIQGGGEAISDTADSAKKEITN